MKRILLIFLVLLFFPTHSFAARTVTVPFSENFDTDFTDLDWLVNGATATHRSTGGWEGGARRFTPPSTTYADGTNGGYSALGSFNFTSPVTTLHIRVMMRFGSTYISTSRAGGGNEQNKIIIADGTATRAMVSLREWTSPSKDFTFGPCDNAVCRYENGEGTASEGGDWWPTSANTFKLSEHLGEWIVVEWAINSVTGTNRLYIWTADGTVEGLYKEYQVATGGSYNTIQVIGGFYNGYNVSDPNSFIEFDQLQVSTSFIGPPSGFGAGGSIDQVTSPSTPTSVTVGQNASVSVDYVASMNRDLVTLFELDSSPYTVYETVTSDLTTGSGTANINVPIPSGVPIAPDAYRFRFYLTTDGGSYAGVLSETQVGGIDAVSPASGGTIIGTVTGGTSSFAESGPNTLLE